MSNVNAENWTAIATVVIAAFTIVLAISGGVQAWLTRKAINLARDEFVATHRPRVVLQQIDVFNRRLQIKFANAGETPALIIDWYARLYYRDSRSAFWPDGDGPPEVKSANFWIEAGQTKTITVEDIQETTGREQFKVGEADMFVVGVVNYSGRDKISRSTGFCRKWFKGDGSWRIQRHSEFEYRY